MIRKEIKKYLLKGQKVKKVNWPDGKFIYAKNNTVFNQDNKEWNDSVINNNEFYEPYIKNEQWKIVK